MDDVLTETQPDRRRHDDLHLRRGRGPADRHGPGQQHDHSYTYNAAHEVATSRQPDRRA